MSDAERRWGRSFTDTCGGFAALHASFGAKAPHPHTREPIVGTAMRSLTVTEDRVVDWHEVADPRIQGPGEAIVRPLAVALCDLDRPIIIGEPPVPPPVAIGHECVAEVVEVGEGVTSFAPGDLVVVPFQISCGTCDRCRAGLTGDCREVQPGSM